jgi:UDP-N-acetylglucosamine diphosphorylase / glucose-1-phosphate thymidylyltransferase / UDP-N-acetylgalactosamine diphosphorylase / glucosamine-1-phosphate N-acetyltransferase / galactosamine-1-phosphate N-acetyltransferase
MVEPRRFFALHDERVRRLFDGVDHVWEALPLLPAILSSWLDDRRLVRGDVARGAVIDDGPVFVAAGARIEPGAYVRGPAYIGPGAVVRHGAYVRQNSILLDGSVLGHASEMKNSVLLPGAKAPHFAYVGDSVLGERVNLGAGTKVSNTTITGTSIRVTVDGITYDTGLTKLGAIVGDGVRTGCNVVLNPGTLLEPRVLVYPNTSVRGHHPAESILKLRQEVTVVIAD